LFNYRNLLRKKPILSISDYEKQSDGLNKTLSVKDLTSLGIAAIVGAGIFSTIGNAAANGGPAVSLLFAFTALACLFSALCYAQFASSVPVSGSAYTYAYIAFGELAAWIIGWDLLMEYAIGNIAVAISWSDYFTSLLQSFSISFPEYLSVDFVSAYRGHKEADVLLKQGHLFGTLQPHLQLYYQAWVKAPAIGGLRLIADVPALGITTLITALVYIGIKESKTAGNIMVAIKLCVILVVIAVGAFYIDTVNWKPFAPNGISGILKGVSAVFFAYIGFDAISTTAEECKNPQRDLPRAMMYALGICTVLYIVVTLVLTGMVNYKYLGVGDPIAFAFEQKHLDFLSAVIALSAIVAMSSVLLVFQIGQPRIWMSMSRDGLLPKVFSRVHPKFKTPSFATIVTGVFVGGASLFMNLTEVTDLSSIGTLFAFALVCGGVLVTETPQSGFKVPYYNSRYYLPAISILIGVLLVVFNGDDLAKFFSYDNWGAFSHKIPVLSFIVIFIFFNVLCILKQLSVIPVLGLLSTLYLMSEMGITNWLRFLVWLLVGLAIYFLYSYKKSKLNIKALTNRE